MIFSQFNIQPIYVQTAEKTGKRYKAGQVIGGLSAITCDILSAGGVKSELTTGLCVLGIIIWAISRFGAWWNHG